MISLFFAVSLFLSPVLESATAARASFEDSHGKLPWFTGSLDEAITRAQLEKKLIFVDFWTTWCTWCKKIDRETYSDDSVLAATKDIVCINVDAESKLGAPFTERYKPTGFPTMVVLESDGRLRERLTGYLTPVQFKAHLARILAMPSLDELTAQVAADAANVELRWQLATRLSAAEDTTIAESHVAEIKRLDPDGKSKAMHFIALQGVMERVQKLWEQRKEAQTPGLLQAFVATETFPEVQFRAWNVLGQIYGVLARQASDPAEAGRHNAAARNAQVTAWHTAPDSEALAFGKQVLREFEANKNKLSADDELFALEVAGRIETLGAADSEALDLVACAKFMNGKKDEALAHLRRAIEIDPIYADPVRHLKEFGG
ncbi:MAG: thioredoxin family protein [Planctomycetota bacterium]|nr:thioredoxin family protein [Planctomycetota bacterium]